MVEINNLSKSFSNNKVLNDISFKFDRGVTNLVIGKSGSGKTVLLKCLLSLYKIDFGEIKFDGLNIKNISNKKLRILRKDIGVVFQGGALFDSMNIEENIMFPLHMFSNLSFDEKKYQVNKCLKRVNLINKNKLFPSQISGGMKKRVSIARAIVLSPKYLICDEPNSGLDPYTSILIDNLLQEITYENNMTTIINTHDMNSLMQIGDKILYINNGLVVWEGNKDQILDSTNHELNKFVFSSRLFKKIKL
tara:strand:+ start:931 stop:1677 length:747 start_codon:yes stop_codon:yes gene_type:complete